MFVDGKLVPNTELGHIYLPNQKYDAEYKASSSAKDREGLSYKQFAKRVDQYLKYMHGLFYPTLFILGGGISKEHEKFIPRLTVEAEVVPALLRNHAGIIGAAMAATERA
jgi:polyphosphate glucokinase